MPYLPKTLPKTLIGITTFFILLLVLGKTVLAICDLSIDNVNDCPPDQNPNYNLGLYTWVPLPNGGGLYYYNHPVDSGAPQLTGLISGNPYPQVTNSYTINPISGVDSPSSWASHVLPGQGATLVGFGTNPGQQILLPSSGYDIGGGYNAIVMYADSNSLTLKYTLEDNIVYGYTLYLENLNVNPEIIDLYNQAVADGRQKLPALDAFQNLGTASSNEILVAIRDTGAFMDPRWQNDWWQAILDPTIPLPPELIDLLAGLPPSPGTTPTPLLQCENPNAVKGPLRPEPCGGCGEELMDGLLFTPSCAETFEVGQKTWVHVGNEDSSEIEKCAGDTENSEDYFFMRSWGGKLEIDPADTKVPFANYHDKQTEQETKYLSAYLTGTYGRYGAKCDIEDPECVKQIFRESGVLVKLLPKEIQDKYRCEMIAKVNSTLEFDYKVTDGKLTKKVSDFSSHQLPCLQFARSPNARQEWLIKKDSPEWKGTEWEKLWPFIPLVTYKDAPGTLIVQPQTGSKYPKAKAVPSTFPLSVPHLGTLYEASKILHQALVPNLQEHELSAQKNKPVLLASAEIDRQLESNLAKSKSLCGYQQILGEQTRLLAQENSPASNPYVGLNGNATYDPNSDSFSFNVQINNNDAYGFHIETLTFDIDGNNYAYRPGAYTVVDTSINVSNQNLGINSISIQEGQTITINVTLISKDADPNQMEQVFTLQGEFTLINGKLVSNWGEGVFQPVQQPKRCGNQDTDNPGACKDPNAKEDDYPNDVICSAPFPILATFDVQNYSNTMSPETFQKLKDKVSGCITACQKDNNSPNCRPPCDWQTFDTAMTRDIGVSLELPYLDQIGHYTISNYYRYTEPKGTFVAADLPKEQSVYGIFDIFRPAEMENYEPLEAKSNIKYKYTDGISNAGKVPDHESGIISGDWEPKRIKNTIYNNPSEGEFYYPWLGGIQWARKCISENILLPSEFQEDEYFCPSMNN